MFTPQTPTTIHFGLWLALSPWSLQVIKVLLTLIIVGLGTLAIGKPIAQLWVPRSPSAQKTVVTMVNTLGFLIGAWIILRILF